MGTKSSPFQCVQGLAFAVEVIKGDRKNKTNVFRWEKVKLNLPGSLSFDPAAPWLCLVKQDGTMAVDLFKFVDDLRSTGTGEAEAWEAAKRIAGIIGWLGLQDAPRKRRGSSQTPGAWAGTKIKI